MMRTPLLIVVALIGCGGKGTLSIDSGNPPPKDGDVATDAIAGAGGGAAGTEGLAGSGAAAGSTGEVDAAPGGRTGDGGVEAGAMPLAITDYFAEAVRVTCDFYARCDLYPDAATCRDVNTIGSDGMTLLADIAAGRVLYDGARARACLDAFAASATCSYTGALAQNALPDPCIGAFTGLVPAGAVCFTPDECVAGTDCLLAAECTMACCAGTCVTRAPRGGSCAAALCPTGSYCRGQTLRCTTQATVEGTVCDAQDGCAAPLFCAFDEQGNGTCEKTLPATGAACQPTVGCDDYRDLCAANNVCARRIGLGRACSNASADPQGGCVNYGYCQAGVCRGYGLPGEACRSDPATGNTDCLGLACPATTLKCTTVTATSCR